MNDKTAKDIMTTDVIVAKKDDSIANVATLLISILMWNIPICKPTYDLILRFLPCLNLLQTLR